MPRKESMAVPQGNGPIPQNAYVVVRGVTLEDFRRLMSNVWDRKTDKLTEDLKRADQRLVMLEQSARQSRLAMEADGPANTKNRERTEGAATEVQTMHRDSCSANQVDPDPTCSTSFCDDCTGPPTLPCSREDAPVDNGAAAPKPCPPPLEMRTTTTAGGLLPTAETSTATKTTFDYSTRWFCQTEETHSERTSIPSVWYDDSSFQRNNCLLPPPAGGSLRQNPGKTGGSSRRFSRLSLCLPGFGNVARVALWGGSC